MVQPGRPVLDRISLLDRLSDESGHPDRNPNPVAAKAWYVRLAKLEERDDGSGKAEHYVERHLRGAKKLGWAWWSEEAPSSNRSEGYGSLDTLSVVVSELPVTPCVNALGSSRIESQRQERAPDADRQKKRGDAAWEYCVALFPVTVLTTVTKNREQEVM